jgi:ribosomal protein S7
MPRRRVVAKREILPDPLYNSQLVTKFINSVMGEGKKSVAEGILYGALNRVAEKTQDDPMKAFKKAIENVKPALEVKSRRVGGSTYQVPVEVRPNRRTSLAIRWIIDYATQRGEKTMREKLAAELMDAANLRGGAVKKKTTRTRWRRRTRRSPTTAGNTSKPETRTSNQRPETFRIMPRTHPLKDTRNIGIMAHIDAGKTTTTERILFYTGVNYKLGEVHEAPRPMDWMVQEQERGITITSAATTCFWKSSSDGTLVRINIIDTPGTWTSRPRSSDRCASSTARSPCSTRRRRRAPVGDRVAPGEPLRRSPARLRQQDGPRRRELPRCVEMMKTKLHAKPAPIQIPWGTEAEHRGVIDLVAMKAIEFHDDAQGSTFDVLDIPADMQAEADKYREMLVEAVAETDDTLLEKYLHGGKVEAQEIKDALRRATIAGHVQPVVCGSAFKNKGVQQLLDAVVDYLPSPLDIPPIKGHDDVGAELERPASDDAPFAALIFKIMTDPFVGQLAFFRVYSGHLDAGSGVFNSTKDTNERIGRLLKMHANKREEIKEVWAGDIAAAVGLRNVQTGRHDLRPGSAGHPRGDELPEPVIAVAIEPKTKADQEKDGRRALEAHAGGPHLQGPHGQGDGADHHPRHGRAPSRDHHGPHGPRVQRRREHRQAAGRVPRGDHEGSAGTRPLRAASRAAAASTARRRSASSRPRPATSSSSTTRSRAARSRRSSSSRSSRASRRPWRRASSRATRRPASTSSSTTARSTTSTPRDGVQDRGLHGVPGRGEEGQAGHQRSRSWTSRSSCPRTTWATSSAT